MSDALTRIEERGIQKGRSEGMALGRSEGMALGRSEGMEEGILSSIKNLMSFMAFNAEQAMKALGVPDADYQKYLKKLQQ